MGHSLRVGELSIIENVDTDIQALVVGMEKWPQKRLFRKFDYHFEGPG
jgi:hypothetical protein